jgi:ABC-2 type transport system ATP-binding protein
MERLPFAIEAAGLGRDYGSTCALESLDLQVAAGTKVGLLGPNGAGKTTTMLLLATLLKPSRGLARVFGHDVTRERSAIRRRLGLVFQEPSIDGLLTVQENLLFAARLAGISGDAARHSVSDALTRGGLARYASKPARQLSTGWRRLADLLRSLLHRPDLLILDEPTVGLDPEHRERAWRLLDAERVERRTTILFSTHYMAEAEDCDQVVLLAHGRAVATGTPSALKAKVGDEIVEVEGGEVEPILSILADAVDVRATIRTERGVRIGVCGPRERLAQLTAQLAAATVQRQSITIRPVTLEDVYFTQTPTGQPASARGLAEHPA